MKKKKFLILFLILLLVVGYAAVTSTLNITGLTKVGENKDDFDVYFSNAKEGTKEGTVENKKVIKDDTHISFSKDMKSVGETYVLEYDVTNGSRTYDAAISINCTNSTEYLKITNEFDTTTNLPATETRSGKLTVEVIKSYVGTTEAPKLNTEISCEIVGSGVERTSRATGTPANKVVHEKPWKLTNDADNNGELSIGDLITLGTESFYVYNVDGENVKAMAQYNLDTSGIQGPTALGFREDTDLNSQSPVGQVTFKHEGEEFVVAYESKLNELDGQVNDVRYITAEELDALGCSSTDATCSGAPAWVYATSYWITTESTINSNHKYWGNGAVGVLLIASDNQLIRTNNSYDHSAAYANCITGMRPVITVSKAIIEVPEKPKAWKLTNDADSNGELSIGDLITLGTESFYVYNVDGENVKAIAQYNLLVEGGKNVATGTGTGLQDATALGDKSGSTTIGTVAFDADSNVYADSTIKTYVDAYGTKLNELNGSVSNVGLITKEELEALGCNSSSITCKDAPEFVYVTSYWTSSPRESNSSDVYSVSSDGHFGYGNFLLHGDSYFGVRPVITISKSLIG